MSEVLDEMLKHAKTALDASIVIEKLEDELGEERARLNRYELALQAIAAKGPASPGDKKHEMAAEALKRDTQT